jgi:hypothetical protein
MIKDESIAKEVSELMLEFGATLDTFAYCGAASSAGRSFIGIAGQLKGLHWRRLGGKGAGRCR